MLRLYWPLDAVLFQRIWLSAVAAPSSGDTIVMGVLMKALAVEVLSAKPS